MHTIIKQDVGDILRIMGNEIYKLEGKNILVTGAAGMLPSYLVYTIIEANKTIFKKPCNLYLILRKKTRKFGNEKHIHYKYCDVAKSKPIFKEDFHFIIHAASKAAPKLYVMNMLDTLNTNIKGLYYVLDLVTAKTESMLYFSSGEVYGEPENIKSITENYIGRVDHLNKRSCYIEGKRACETILMNYFWEKQYPIKIARIFHTFGPGLNLEDGRVFSDFIRNGWENKDVEIKGDKNIVRPILYIKDATIMFFKILFSDKNGEVYNVGNEKNTISVGELANITCQVSNEIFKHNNKVKIKKQNIKYYSYALKEIHIDISKFINTLNYKPDTMIKEAIKRTFLSLLVE